jgi:hypothetical protein
LSPPIIPESPSILIIMRTTNRNYIYYTCCTLLVLFNQVRACAESPSSEQHSKCEIGSAETRADDVWLISTRHLDCECLTKGDQNVDLRIQRSLSKDEWVEATLDDFLNSQTPGQSTLFYVHGNRMDSRDAVDRGWDAYHSLLDGSDAPPTRFVIWSWPSAKVHGQVHDVRVKAERTNSEAHYFAWLLGHLDHRSRVSFVGYSFGARVISGALHVLSGGELVGCTLSPELRRPRGSARVAFVAAALHNHWLQPNGVHELATSQIEHLLVQYNSSDPVLKRYRIIEKHGRPEALGYTGMYDDGSSDALIEQYDVRRSVGKTHAEAHYFRAPPVIERTRRVLLDW